MAGMLQGEINRVSGSHRFCEPTGLLERKFAQTLVNYGFRGEQRVFLDSTNSLTAPASV